MFIRYDKLHLCHAFFLDADKSSGTSHRGILRNAAASGKIAEIFSSVPADLADFQEKIYHFSRRLPLSRAASVSAGFLQDGSEPAAGVSSWLSPKDRRAPDGAPAPVPTLRRV